MKGAVRAKKRTLRAPELVQSVDEAAVKLRRPTPARLPRRVPAAGASGRGRGAVRHQPHVLGDLRVGRLQLGVNAAHFRVDASQPLSARARDALAQRQAQIRGTPVPGRGPG